LKHHRQQPPVRRDGHAISGVFKADQATKTRHCHISLSYYVNVYICYFFAKKRAQLLAFWQSDASSIMASQQERLQTQTSHLLHHNYILN
jgi:hypothetical protein